MAAQDREADWLLASDPDAEYAERYSITPDELSL